MVEEKEIGGPAERLLRIILPVPYKVRTNVDEEVPKALQGDEDRDQEAYLVVVRIGVCEIDRTGDRHPDPRRHPGQRVQYPPGEDRSRLVSLIGIGAVTAGPSFIQLLASIQREAIRGLFDPADFSVNTDQTAYQNKEAKVTPNKEEAPLVPPGPFPSIAGERVRVAASERFFRDPAHPIIDVVQKIENEAHNGKCDSQNPETDMRGQLEGPDFWFRPSPADGHQVEYPQRGHVQGLTGTNQHGDEADGFAALHGPDRTVHTLGAARNRPRLLQGYK